jgi:hypothetical protein
MSKEDDDNSPPGEAEDVVRVRTLCTMGMLHAKALGEPDLTEESRAYEWETYLKRKESALSVARRITDVFYRDAALDSIIQLCLAGGEFDYAKKLFEVIEVDVVQRSLLKEHPELGAKF